MRASSSSLLALILLASTIASPSFAADPPLPPLAPTGSAKLAAFSVCRSLSLVDLGDVGSNSSAECAGIVKTTDGSKPLDNLAIRCLEESKARKDGYGFTGTCVETDADGDKIYLSYEGPESGPLTILGGTGKYKGIDGAGKWTVADAPGNTASQFAFTLDYTMEWRFK